VWGVDVTTVTKTDGTEKTDSCKDLECPGGAKPNCKLLKTIKQPPETTKSSTDSEEQKKKAGAKPGDYSWKSTTETVNNYTFEVYDCTCPDGSDPTTKKVKKGQEGGGDKKEGDGTDKKKEGDGGDKK
jgi:hypothetical protein